MMKISSLQELTNLAPIVLFTYKRLQTTRAVVDALLENPEASRSKLIIFSDAPKVSNDILKVEEVRHYLTNLTGFESIEINLRDKNLGLAQSFIQGITEILSKYDKAIFLEDDNLVSKHFLSFMNSALNFYEYNQKVICISGYSFPLLPKKKHPYFLRGAETWSMGTWRRSWKYFCSDSSLLLSKVESGNLTKKFRSDGFGFYEMLQQQNRGEIDSWGVCWWTSSYINNRYCLYPHQPLCVSIGFGSDSVHCKGSWKPIFRQPYDLADAPILDLPEDVDETFDVSFSIKLMNFILSEKGIIPRLIKKMKILWFSDK